jgi:hypothetical protein
LSGVLLGLFRCFGDFSSISGTSKNKTPRSNSHLTPN